LLFFTDLGYDIQKYVSIAAVHIDAGFGNERQFVGIKASFGVPQMYALSYRYNVGAAYYWSDYDNMYSGWEISSGSEWGVNIGGLYATSSCTFYDRKGTEYDQYRDVITAGYTPLFNIQVENDTKDLHLGFLPGMPKHEHSDKYMTSEIRLRVGLLEFGTTAVTGRPYPGANDKNGGIIEGGPNGTYAKVGDYDPDEYREGIFYVQIGALRVGYNSETIRDNTQNWLHDLIGTPRFKKLNRPDKWYWEINF